MLSAGVTDNPAKLCTQQSGVVHSCSESRGGMMFPAEQGSVSITRSYQACLPLDLIPNLATLKTLKWDKFVSNPAAPMSVLDHSRRSQ